MQKQEGMQHFQGVQVALVWSLIRTYGEEME